MATPMLIAQLLNLLYNIVDRIYIGKIPGEGTLALASIGLCFPFVTLITAFANLFGLGGAPLCAMARGKGNREGAQGIMVNAGFMLLLSGAGHQTGYPRGNSPGGRVYCRALPGRGHTRNTCRFVLCQRNAPHSLLCPVHRLPSA